jgi:hypothetical protein
MLIMPALSRDESSDEPPGTCPIYLNSGGRMRLTCFDDIAVAFYDHPATEGGAKSTPWHN